MNVLNSDEHQIKLNECQKKCVEYAKERKKNKQQLLMMIMGGPGTGKTFTIQHLLNSSPFKNYPRDTVALGSFSALAACNVAKNTRFDGKTLHRIFRIKVDSETSSNEIPSVTSMMRKICKGSSMGLKLLIIDEISMLPSHLLELIDKILQRDNETEELFGKIDIILMGDYEQLRPVAGKSTENHEITSRFKRFDLIEQKRADNIEDQNLLTRIRRREVTDEDINRLKQRCIDPENNLCLHILKTNNGPFGINMHNNTTVKEIYMPWKTKIYSFDLEIEETEGLDNIDQYNHTISNAKSKSNLLDTLKIKQGCPVICRNNCKQMGLNGLVYDIYNGKMGNVYGVTKKKENGEDVDNIILVKFNDIDTIICVKRVTVEVHSGGENSGIIAKLHQFPLHLGFAITCWKVQGMTLKKDYVIGYFPNVEEFRQLYVMLTRCEKLENVYFSFKDKTSNPHAYMTKSYFNHVKSIDRKRNRDITDYMISANTKRMVHTPLPLRANVDDIILCTDVLLF